MNRADFKKLTLTRLSDAQTLLRKRRFSGAYYTAGYAVECALKACIAKKTKRFDFPPDPEYVKRECYTHSLEQLLKASGLSGAFQMKFKTDDSFGLNWSVVNKWSEKSRYKLYSIKDARDMLVAITDPTRGVLGCIKQYW